MIIATLEEVSKGYKARYYNDSFQNRMGNVLINTLGSNAIFLEGNKVVIQYNKKKVICTLKDEFLKSAFYRDLVNGGKNKITGFHEAISKRNINNVTYGFNIKIENQYERINEGEYLIKKDKGLLLGIK